MGTSFARELRAWSTTTAVSVGAKSCSGICSQAIHFSRQGERQRNAAFIPLGSRTFSLIIRTRLYEMMELQAIAISTADAAK